MHLIWINNKEKSNCMYFKICFNEFIVNSDFDQHGSKSINPKISLCWKDTFWSFFKLYNWKCTNRKWNNRNKNIQIYKEGIKEFNSELDWVYIINSIRKLNAFIEEVSTPSSALTTSEPPKKYLHILSPTQSPCHKVSFKPN